MGKEKQILDLTFQIVILGHRLREEGHAKEAEELKKIANYMKENARKAAVEEAERRVNAAVRLST